MDADQVAAAVTNKHFFHYRFVFKLFRIRCETMAGLHRNDLRQTEGHHQEIILTYILEQAKTRGGVSQKEIEAKYAHLGGPGYLDRLISNLNARERIERIGPTCFPPIRYHHGV